MIFIIKTKLSYKNELYFSEANRPASAIDLAHSAETELRSERKGAKKSKKRVGPIRSSSLDDVVTGSRPIQATRDSPDTFVKTTLTENGNGELRRQATEFLTRRETAASCKRFL